MSRKLILAATNARAGAYAPHSGFYVGCAILCHDGTIVTAANIECSNSSCGICAERLAISKAVFDKKGIVTLCLVSGGPKVITPCGVCRQFMADFGPFRVICANIDRTLTPILTTTENLLPMRYHRER